ncbi:hypothetical protein RZS08_35490, partial [Arthrospira platensis SPKY1]|nr:hypothetical protein [Arthrospira platensis SPKY1]
VAQQQAQAGGERRVDDAHRAQLGRQRRQLQQPLRGVEHVGAVGAGGGDAHVLDTVDADREPDQARQAAVAGERQAGEVVGVALADAVLDCPQLGIEQAGRGAQAQVEADLRRRAAVVDQDLH